MYDFALAFDIETTGFSFTSDSILEIGAVLLNLKTDEKANFSVLVDTKKAIPESITKITGINRNTLVAEGCKPLKEALEDFVAFSKVESSKVLFIGHNLFLFDLKFMNPVLKKHKLPEIKLSNCWCTLLQTRADIAGKRASSFTALQKDALAYRTKESVTLAAACKYYSLKVSTPNHRALPDSLTTLHLFKEQVKRRKYRL